MSNGTAAPQHPPGALRHRVSVDKLSEPQLDRLREAFRLSGEKQDNTGFAWFAGLHGVPQHFCQHHVESEHGRRFFLPWHRAYLYSFELSLQELVDDVTLPWWDWTYDADHPRLVPEPFARARLPNRRANPLYSQAIPLITTPTIARQPRQSSRGDRGPDPRWQPTWEYVDRVLLNIKDYFTFSLQLEQIHDGIHGAVGGTMGAIAWAAYDPLFWAHHTMIDRIWALWQDRNGITGPTPDMFEDVLAPFNLRIPHVLDITRLGYTYAGTATSGPAG